MEGKAPRILSHVLSLYKNGSSRRKLKLLLTLGFLAMADSSYGKVGEAQGGSGGRGCIGIV